MRSRLRPKLSYSNVIASIALFVALGGAAVAAGLPKHSVGANQLKHGAVTAGAIRKGAVTSGKLAPKSVVDGKLGPNAVTPGNLGNGAITSAKIAAGAVIASSIKNGVITNPKLGNGVVNTAKLAANAVTTPILANGSVTLAKLSPEVDAAARHAANRARRCGASFDVGGDTGGNAARDGDQLPVPADRTRPRAEANILERRPDQRRLPGPRRRLGRRRQRPPGNLCVYVRPKKANLDAQPSTVDERQPARLRPRREIRRSRARKTDPRPWAVTAP